MFLATAVEAARIGGRVLNGNLHSAARRDVSQKQAFDFVTQVDLLSEKAIIDFIRSRHPGHDILAEESGAHAGESEYQWIIDPLDGTKNYIHGFPVFAVSVALRKGREMLVGAVLDPTRDELFSAEKGKGAFLNDDAIHVSASADLAASLIATGFPFRAKHLAKPYFSAFTSIFQRVSDLRRAGAAALDLAYVACGRTDGFWEIGLNLWDIAAGALLVSEAGGKVSDIFGGEDHCRTGNIIASNAHTHGSLVQLVQAPFRDTQF